MSSNKKGVAVREVIFSQDVLSARFYTYSEIRKLFRDDDSTLVIAILNRVEELESECERLREDINLCEAMKEALVKRTVKLSDQCDEAMADAKRYVDTFKHSFVSATHDGSEWEKCGYCGMDLRDDIHWRAWGKGGDGWVTQRFRKKKPKTN